MLEDQLKQSLSDISSDNNLLSNKIIIAYEPVWAIGTGNTASKKDIEEVHKFIKEIINTNYQFNLIYQFYMVDQLIQKLFRNF